MIEATEYVYMPAGAVPIIVVSNSTQSADIVRVTITGVDTDSGIRFLEWLRDKIRADQEAAKAFGLTSFATSVAADPTDRLIHKVINEGDTAPTADVIAIAAETQFRIP